MEDYGYNPADYQTNKSTHSYRGVNYQKVENLFNGTKTSEHFECNCSIIHSEEAVQKFIDTVFYYVPDPFIAI